jgi:hypothetical protein
MRELAPVPEFSMIPGYRIVATVSALDALVALDDPSDLGEKKFFHPRLLRFAPDDVFVFGLAPPESPVADDPHAIIEEETGFWGAWLGKEDFDERVRPHIDWELPTVPRSFSQGFVANVPAKLWLTTDRVLLMTNAAYAHELEERIGE